MISDVIGYEGLYQIDDSGNIFTTRRQGTDGRRIRSCIDKSGYERVYLCKRGKHRTFLLHRLVAETFLDNPENKPCVNHIDGNKQNNNVNNLEWVTYSENMKHAVRNNLNKTPGLKGELHPMHKLNKDQVIEIRKISASGMRNSEIARMFGVTKEQIGNIVSGKHWVNVGTPENKRTDSGCV